MAYVPSIGGGVVSVIPDNALNFDVVGYYSGHFPRGELRLNYIHLNASAVNDAITVRHSAVAGPLLCGNTDTIGGGTVMYPGEFCRPVIVGASCTFGTTAKVTIVFGFDQA